MYFRKRGKKHRGKRFSVSSPKVGKKKSGGLTNTEFCELTSKFSINDRTFYVIKEYKKHRKYGTDF